MEELNFENLRISAKKKRDNPKMRIATRNQHPYHSIAAKDGVVLDPEGVCRARWPNCDTEKYIYSLYSGREVSWIEFYNQVEKSHDFYKRQKFRIFCQEPGKNGRPLNHKTSAGEKRVKTSDKGFPSFPVAINELFAVILRQPYQRISIMDTDFVDTGGELSVISLLHFNQDATWQKTGIKIDQFQIGFLFSGVLYVVDNSTLRVFNIHFDKTVKTKVCTSELATADLEKRDNICLRNNIRSLTATNSHVLLTGENFGFVLLKANSELPIVARGTSEQAYTMGCLSGLAFALGKKDKFLEIWEIDPETDTVKQVNNEAVLVPRRSSITGDAIPISNEAFLGTDYLHFSPERLAISNNANFLANQKRPQNVMVQIPDFNPIISISVFGELCVLLSNEGLITVTQFASGQALFTNYVAVPSFGRSISQTRQQQLTAMTHDTIFVLCLNGDVYALVAIDKLQ